MQRISFTLSILLYSIFLYAQQKEVLIPYGHDFVILDLAFNKSNTKMVSGGKNGEAFVWDLNSGFPLRKLSGHRWDIWSTEFLNDSVCITAGEEGKLIYHNIYTGAYEPQIGMNEYDVVMTFAISPDARYLAALCLVDAPDENWFVIKTIDLKKRKVVFEEQLEHYNLRNGYDGSISVFMDMEFSPDGKFLVTSDNSYLFSWKFNSKKGHCKKYSFGELTHNQRNINFFSDGRMELIDEEGSAFYLDLNDLTTEETGFTGDQSNITEFSTNKDRIFIVEEEAIITIDPKTTEIISSFDTGQKMLVGVKFNPDFNQIFTYAIDGSIRAWNSKTGHLIHEFKSKNSDVTKLEFSSESDILISGHQDNRLRFWDLNKMELTRSVVAGRFDFSPTEHQHGIIGMDINSKEGIIACTSDNSNVWLYDYTTGGLIDSVDVSDVPSDIQLDLNNKYIIANCYDQIFFIRTSDREVALTLDKNLFFNLYDGSFTVNFPKSYFVIDTLEQILYIGNSDGTNGLLGLSLKTLDTVLFIDKSNQNEIVSVHFNSTNKQLITVCKDGNLKIWNTQNLEEPLMATIALNCEPNICEYIPSENILFVSSEEDSLLMFKVENETLTKLYSTYEPNGIDLKYHETKDLLFFASASNYISVRKKSDLELIGKMVSIEDDSYFIVDNDGFYKSDKNSISKIGFLDNRTVVSALQYDIQQNRPDKVINGFGTKNQELTQLYYKAYEKRLSKLGLDEKNFEKFSSVPTLKIVQSGNINPEQITSVCKLHIVASDAKQYLERMNIWVNEVAIFGANGFSLKERKIKELDTTIFLELMEGRNKIEASVSNTNAVESFRSPLYVTYTPVNSYTPKTHFIGMGIDKFNEPGHDLSYSVKDVRDLSKALKEKLGDQLVIDTLFNHSLSVSNVQALKRKLLQTNINDRVIISYSGHGLLNQDYDYFLSSYNVDFQHPEKGGIPYENLEDLLDSIPARKKLLLIDACHSGEVDKEDFKEMSTIAGAKGLVTPKGADAENSSASSTFGLKNSFELMQELFVNVQKGSGATIISAAAGDQFALEGGQLENGFFTYAILQYMKSHEEVKISSLKKFVYNEVEKLSGGLQKPTSRIENLEMDWRIW